MPVWNVDKAAATMRTALVGRPMVRFDAPRLIGPTPQAGRMVEFVEARGRHLEVSWDDGLVLESPLKSRSEWHVYRQGMPWHRSWEKMTASIQTQDFVAVCFDAPVPETYRQHDRSRHPGRGRLGPDLCAPTADLAEVVDLLLAYPDREARLRDVLVDQHVVQGIGNVYRCEVLWAAELSPWAHIADLTHHDALLIVNTAARMVRSNCGRTAHARHYAAGPRLEVYGRSGQGCTRCRETIESIAVGRSGRMLYWCPGCQVRLDRRAPIEQPGIDPHPAAVKYLSHLPWRDRDAV